MSIKINFLNNFCHRLLNDYGKYFRLFSYSAASSILEQLVMPIIALPFLSNKLSQNKFGEFVIVLSILNFFSAIFSATVVMFIYRHHKDIPQEDKPYYFGSTVKLSLILLLIIGILLITIKEPLFRRWDLDFTLQWFLPLVVFMILVSLKTILSAIFFIEMRFPFLMFCNSIYLLLSLSIIVVYSFMPDGPWTLGFVIAPIIITTFMFQTILRERKLDLRSRINRSFLNKFVSTSSLFFIATIMANLLIYGDRWLLAEYDIPKSDIAVYFVAVYACSIVIVIIDQISQFILPVISNVKSYNDITPVQSRKILQITFLSIFFIMIFGSLGGLIYIKLFYGETFWFQGKIIFLIIMGGVVFYPFQLFSRALVIRFHSLWLPVLIYISACMAMLLIVYILYESSGIYAFAYGRLIAYLCISISFFMLVQRPLLTKL